MKTNKREFLSCQLLLCFCAIIAITWNIEISRLGNAPDSDITNATLPQAMAFNTLLGACMLSIIAVLPPLVRWLPYAAILTLILALEFLAILFLSTSKLFYEKTGSYLDIELVIYSIKNFEQLGALLAESAGPAFIIDLLIPPTVLLACCISANHIVLAKNKFFPNAIGTTTALAVVISTAFATTNANATHTYNGVLYSSIFSAELPFINHDKPSAMYSPSIADTTIEQKMNIFIFVLESFRSDLINKRDEAGNEITPFLNKASIDFQFFRNNYTTISHTSKALVGIHCGMFASLAMKIDESRPDSLMNECLPKFLSARGYSTAFIQSAYGRFENRPQLVKNMGFANFVGGEDLKEKGARTLGYFNHDDDYLIAEARNIIERIPPPVYMTTLNSLTHHPYHLPDQHCETIGSTGNEAKKCYLRTAKYVDKHISKMMQLLKEKRLYDDSLIIITGDHGEAFGEHGKFQHDEVPYDEVVKTPLWIKYPDHEPGVSDRLSQHTDIYPTILNLLGIQAIGTLPGKSLIKSGHQSIYTFCWYKPSCMTRVEESGKKYIVNFKSGEVLLFDLAADPGENRAAFISHFRDTTYEAMKPLINFKSDIDHYWKISKAEHAPSI